MQEARAEPFRRDFSAGKAIRAGDYLGGHLSGNGAVFRVWAPEALQVSVVGDFCGWDPDRHPMNRGEGGIWELSIEGLSQGAAYKYAISAKDGQTLWKADPYARFAELRPASASVLHSIEGFAWGDEAWLAHRRKNKVYENPLNIYEVHPGSWRRHEDGSFLSYRELADKLIPYVKVLGFSHIELMPITEYPYDGSWGYQCTGYFAASSRFGRPQDLMYFIDSCHRAEIGVIMDWVPAHFPKDPHGLVEFDGSRLYEEENPLMAEHPSWGTRIFNYARGEVKSFLISSALFWLEHYHIDGLRVDAVASMLYLDYDRKDGAWQPNQYGGRENIGAIDFLRQLNTACFGFDDSVLMIAEESTAWPLVTGPADRGGLGFNLKWNMGWMNDSLSYLKTDPYFRAGSHRQLTFSLMYAFSENYVLPLSHDEVVHMKGSLMGKIPGTDEEKRATVRVFWAYMLAHPGKKLLFMGAELGQYSEWDFASQLPWELLDRPQHKALHDFFSEINRFYQASPPLWAEDFNGAGFGWICPNESEKNIIGFSRRDKKGDELLFVCNFSGAEAKDFRLGVPRPGYYRVALSTDEARFGGSASLTEGSIYPVHNHPHHGFSRFITLSLPPLTAVFLRRTTKKPSG